MFHRRRKGPVVGGHHGECGARAYNGNLGAEGAKPPKAESILVIGCPTETANLAPFHMLCYSPLVSEPRVHGAPNPVIGGGAVPPRLRRLCHVLFFILLFVLLLYTHCS